MCNCPVHQLLAETSCRDSYHPGGCCFAFMKKKKAERPMNVAACPETNNSIVSKAVVGLP